MHPTLINAIKAAMPAQRVQFLISIRDILSVDAPRNKSGSPMLSDLDCMCATHEQQIQAASMAGIDLENTAKIESIADIPSAAAASAASVAYAAAIAAEVYASYAKAAKTKTCPRIESEFRCPSCGGGHFGRDVTTSQDGRMVVSADAHCHDEHKTGCSWVGDYAANLHPARTKST
jgi:glucose/arabinose dehydrogenase